MLAYIIDDNATNLDLFQAVLRRLPFALEIHCYSCPQKALAACTRALPDLLVVDYMMPLMNGHQFALAFRALPGAGNIPMVMVTAATGREIKRTALEIGVTDFLTKPVDIYEMRARLTNLLKLRESQIVLENHNQRLAEEVRAATRNILDRERELIHRLTKASECRDPETGTHIVRMAEYAAIIARKIGLASDYCDLIMRAAPMHDIGKVGIPDNILLKPGALTEAEFELMKQHTVIGHDLLKSSDSELIQLGAQIALSHHEQYDGNGYPNGRVGEKIPLAAQIVSIADVFDALTTVRRYKRAWSAEEAVRYVIEHRGLRFAPRCVDGFLSAMPEIDAIKRKFRDPDDMPEPAPEP
ncbi:MAG: two-component system response regulator [Acidocella sp. 20-63-7]|nr:MAG: two-component system response regulator [Acidocella sp. 20-63-7]HQT45842.1 HD domain-containing protein [Acidocella sp.]